MFEVAVPEISDADVWQFMSDEAIPPERIVGLVRYRTNKIFKNERLEVEVFESNVDEYVRDYLVKDMKKHPEGYSEEELIAFGVKEK